MRPPTQRLQELLRRLGEATQGSVLASSEIRACLAELKELGFDATLRHEVSLASCASSDHTTSDATIQLRTPSRGQQPVYLIDRHDARFLAAVGISPSRHRSPPQGPNLSCDDQPPGQDT